MPTFSLPFRALTGFRVFCPEVIAPMRKKLKKIVVPLPNKLEALWNRALCRGGNHDLPPRLLGEEKTFPIRISDE
jgi:hypothetical protein